MSNENNESGAAAADEVCASCGKAAVDDVKLKKCACNLVNNMVECQRNHRPQHKTLCKKTLTEIREKDLFEQPDSSNLGECSICFFPLPSKSTMTECCSKIICKGCEYENEKLIIQSAFQNAKCLFCREPVANSPGEAHQLTMKRIKKNDPAAMSKLGRKLCNQGDYKTALEYLTKAAKLGDRCAFWLINHV
jgi:hypothetical protein